MTERVGAEIALQALLARMQRSGFAPASLWWVDTLADGAPDPETLGGAIASGTVTELATPFPGSVVGISVVAASNYAGAAGSNYVDFEVLVGGVATGFTARVSGGSRTGTARQAKNEDLVASGDLITVRADKTGTPLGGGIAHVVGVWIAYS